MQVNLSCWMADVHGVPAAVLLTQDDDGGGAVAHFLILCPAELDDALRGKLAAVHSQRPGRCNPVLGSTHMDCGAALEADGREQTGCARQHSSSCSEPGTRASRRRGRQARLASVRLGKGSRGTLAAGCETSISRRMALPSLVMTMPVSVHIILDERPPDHS